MRVWMIIGLFLLLPFHANAESVLQAKGNQFLFEAGMYKNGDILTIFGPDGNAKGTARVKQAGKTKSLAIVTSGSVANGDTVGFDTGGGGMASAGSGSRSKSKTGLVFNAGMNLDLMATFKGSGTYTLGTTQNLESSGKSGTGFALLGEAQYWFSDMWGAYGGIEYALDRKVDGGITHTTPSGSTTVANDDKLSALFFTGGGLMRFGKLYIPVGIVYPMVTYKSSNGGTQVAGQLGFQFGGGWMITDRIGAEFNYRITNFQLRIDGTTTGTFIYTSASVTSMFLTGKFFF